MGRNDLPLISWAAAACLLGAGARSLLGAPPDSKAALPAKEVSAQGRQRPAGLPAPDDETGFRPLLDALSLSHWRQCGPGHFEVNDGIATAVGGMGLWWFTEQEYGDFVLRGEFLQEQPLADSGVFLRFPDPANDPWVAVNLGHEVEIGDPAPTDPTWRTGSVYPFQASDRANTLPLGQWNSYEIVCRGQLYLVSINGEEVTRWTDPKRRATRGYLGLQNYNDGKTVRHRRLRVRALPPTPAP